MLSKLLTRALDEIAFHPAPGISWPQLWEAVQAELPPQRDPSLLRGLLWQQLTVRPDVLLRTADGQLYRRAGGNKEVPEPPLKEPKEPRGHAKDSKKKAGTEKSTKGQAAESKSANRTILLDLRDASRYKIMHVSSHPDLIANPTIIELLRIIGRTRYNGCWSAFLGLELEVPQRDLFYLLEGLRLVGLLISFAGSMPAHMIDEYHARAAAKGDKEPARQTHVGGNILFHSKFFDADKVEAAQVQLVMRHTLPVVKAQISGALERSLSKAAFESELRSLVKEALREVGAVLTSGRLAGTIYNRIRTEFMEQKKVECIRVWDPMQRIFRDALCVYGAHKTSEEPQASVLALEDAQASPRALLDGAPRGTGAQEAPADRAGGESGLETRTPQGGQVPEEGAVEEPKAEDDGEEREETANGLEQAIAVRERPLFFQCMDLVEVCSRIRYPGAPDIDEKGVLGPELQTLLGLRRKASENIFHEMLRTKQIGRILESDGRAHVNRYMNADEVDADVPAGRVPPSRIRYRGSAAEKARLQQLSAKQKEDPASKRHNVTFERRRQRLLVLLEERSVVTITDFQQVVEEENLSRQGKMDRRSAARIFDEVSKADKRVKVVLGEASFAYWAPAITTKKALEKVNADIQAKRSLRNRRPATGGEALLALTDGNLAITDGSSGQDAMAAQDDSSASAAAAAAAEDVAAGGACLAVVPIAAKKQLLQEAAAESMEKRKVMQLDSEPLKPYRAVGAERRLLTELRVDSLRGHEQDFKPGNFDQKVLTYNGFQAPVMVRAQLLHRCLLDCMMPFIVQGEPQAWSPMKILDELDVPLFLQIIGCARQSVEIEQLLLASGRPLKLRELEPRIKSLLLTRTTTQYGPRTMMALRRLLGHLAKLSLVQVHATSQYGAPAARGSKEGEQSFSHSGVRVMMSHISYSVKRTASLASYVSDAETEQALEIGCWDFADPLAFGEYWQALRGNVQSWLRCQKEKAPAGGTEGPIDTSAPEPAAAEQEEVPSSSSASDEEEAEDTEAAAAVVRRRGCRKGQAKVELPANCNLPELFRLKNWKNTSFLNPQQRAAIDSFMQGLCKQNASPAPVQATGKDCTVLTVHQPRVFIATSPEVVALARKICVPPARIVKHCQQQAQLLAKEAGGDGSTAPAVAFSALRHVRYRCHHCNQLFFQKTAVRDHYLRVHESEMPEDGRALVHEDYGRDMRGDRRSVKTKVWPGKRRKRRKDLLHSEHSSDKDYDDLAANKDASQEGATRQSRKKKPRRTPPSSWQHHDDVHDAEKLRPRSRSPRRRQVWARKATEDADMTSQAEPVWGDDAEDGDTWISLMVSAERVTSQLSGVPSSKIGSSLAAVPPEAWRWLGQITGRRHAYCRTRLRRLLRKDKVRQRHLSILRSDAAKQDAAVSHSANSEILCALGRSLAKCLVLTSYRSEEPWWSSAAFCSDTRDILEWACQQWQSDGVVCKYKPVNHGQRLPEGSRPRYLLTWQARLQLFGRGEIRRFAEAAAVAQSVQATGEGEAVQETCTGSFVLAMAEMLAQGNVELEALWGTSSRPEGKEGPAEEQTAWRSVEEAAAADGDESSGFADDGDDDDEDSQSSGHGDALQAEAAARALAGLTAERPKTSVRTYLQHNTEREVRGFRFRSTVDTAAAVSSKGGTAPCPKVVDATARAAFSQWFRVQEDELERLQPQGPTEPLHPLLYASASDVEASCDKSAQDVPNMSNQEVWEEGRPRGAREGLVVMPGNDLPTVGDEPAAEAFEQYVETYCAQYLHGADAKHLLPLAAAILKTVRDGGGCGHREADRLLPCSPVSHLRAIAGAAAFDDVVARGTGGPPPRPCSENFEALFRAALTCLEMLGLLVPVTFGSEFVEMLGGAAAPYCVRSALSGKKKPRANSHQGRGGGGGEGGGSEPAPAARALRCILRQCSSSGAHWLAAMGELEVGSPEVRKGAAMAVAAAAGLVSTGASMKQLLLPDDLIAPSPWLDASGAANTQVVRWLTLQLWQQLTTTPGLTAAEIAEQYKVLDECEVLLILEALQSAGFATCRDMAATSSASPGHTEAGGMLRHDPTLEAVGGGCRQRVFSSVSLHEAFQTD
eukprot:TRINITY_DN7938_c1_g1_i1.p1 TRINITY_DN7938_c1_g1~~TRINITY_DN7938_c1_g1_i1.p1  ORF type:complete len:2091 (+),score=542.33 TRINITY_DN7938_c1_g1_i1:191-6463(+)